MDVPPFVLIFLAMLVISAGRSIIARDKGLFFETFGNLCWIVLLILCGPGLLIWVVRDAVLAHQSQFWPQTTAQVVSSEVDRVQRFLYQPALRYHYQVRGVTYESTTFRFDLAFGKSQRDAEAFVQRHPPGATLTIRYNPDTPALACIEPGGIALRTWIAILPLSGMTTLFGLCAVVYWFGDLISRLSRMWRAKGASASDAPPVAQRQS